MRKSEVCQKKRAIRELQFRQLTWSSEQKKKNNNKYCTYKYTCRLYKLLRYVLDENPSYLSK